MSNDNKELEPIAPKNNIGSLINFNDYASSLIKRLAPITEIYANIGRSLVPMARMQEEVLKNMKPLVDIQRQNQLMLQEFAKSAQNMLKPLDNFRFNLENLISPAFLEFTKNLATLPERTRKSLMVLAKHGWYFDPEMPFAGIRELENALENGDIDAVNEDLIEYFSERLSEIEENIKRKFPARASILAGAFSAHRREEYALSIPVFLIQADGICFDLINKQLYSKKGKVPVVAEYAETITTDIFRSALLYPLTQPLPISASANERTEDFNHLNRHQVIHGESTDYDTALNSFKAISLLNYVSYVLSQVSFDTDENIEEII
jgi:hypothetical protein